MGSAAAELTGELLPIVGQGIRVLLKSALGTAVLALALLTASFFLAGEGGRGALAALATSALCTVAGVFLALKRAVLSTVRAAIVKSRLGERTVGLIFQRVIEKSVVGRAAERVPLKEAEALLTGAIDGLLADSAAGGGLRGKLAGMAQRRVVDLVAQATLAEFRSEDQKQSGVDLELVRKRLSETMQDGLVARLDSMLVSITAFIVTGLVVVSLGMAFVIGRVTF